MDPTIELFAKVSINTIETKMKLSLDEIESNNPNRTDLIDSLRESLEDVYIVKHYMMELMENYNIEKKLSYRLADLNADLRLRIAKREEELTDLQREL